MNIKKSINLLLVTLLLTGCSSQSVEDNSQPTPSATVISESKTSSLLVPIKEYSQVNNDNHTVNTYGFDLNEELVTNYIPFTQDQLNKIAQLDGVLAIEPTVYSLDYLTTNEQDLKNHESSYATIFDYTERNHLGFNEQYTEYLEIPESLILERREDLNVYSLPINHPFIVNDMPMLTDGYLNAMSTFDLNEDVLNHQIYPFYVVGDWKDIPLDAGEYPSDATEVVISVKAAEIIKSIYGLSSDDEILGMELPFGVITEKSIILFNEVTTYTGAAFDTYNYVIKGITTVEDSDEAIVFFNEDVSNMEMIHSYVTNKDNLTYQSIRILLNSSANPTLVLDEVNAIIGDYGNVFTIE